MTTEDLYADAARARGLCPLHDRLSADDIPHTLATAGGAPPEMYVRVPLSVDAFLAVVRHEANDEDGQESRWDFARFLDAAGEVEDAFVDNVTTEEVLAAIHFSRGEA